MTRLGAYRGIAALGALTIASEVGDWRRFAIARTFMGFTGLVPSEYSSEGPRATVVERNVLGVLLEGGVRQWHDAGAVLVERDVESAMTPFAIRTAVASSSSSGKSFQ